MKQQSEGVTSRLVAEALKAYSLQDPNNSLVADVSVRKIGDKDFAIFDMEVKSDLGKQNVRAVIVCHKSHSINFVLTYWENEKDLTLMMAAVEGIRFYYE